MYLKCFMRSLTHLHRSSLSFFFSLCFLFFSGTIFSQPVINGKITGRDGIALSGATIKVKATNIFTLADSIGRFTIKANPGDVIEFSFVGYHNRQHSLGNETELNISLTETTVNLNE